MKCIFEHMPTEKKSPRQPAYLPQSLRFRAVPIESLLSTDTFFTIQYFLKRTAYFAQTAQMCRLI